MNLEILNGTASQVNQPIDPHSSEMIAIPQHRRSLLKTHCLIWVATLPLFASVMPALAHDSPVPSAPTLRGISNLAQLAVSGGGKGLFPTHLSARGEDDDKCIWLGVCN